MTYSPLYSVTGTLNQLDATPNIGRVVLSLDNNASVTNGLGSLDTLTCNQLEITSSFLNPFGPNPGSSGEGIQNNGSSVLSWAAVPSAGNSGWTSGGFYLRTQSTTGDNPSENYQIIQAYFRNQGNAVYMTVDFNVGGFVTAAGFGNIAYFTTFERFGNVTATSTMPSYYIPSIMADGSTGSSIYLGTIPVTNLDSGFIYNGNCFLIRFQGNANNNYGFYILPGGFSSGSQFSYFPPAYTYGYIFGVVNPGSIPNTGQPVTFMYTI